MADGEDRSESPTDPILRGNKSGQEELALQTRDSATDNPDVSAPCTFRTLSSSALEANPPTSLVSKTSDPAPIVPLLRMTMLPAGPALQQDRDGDQQQGRGQCAEKEGEWSSVSDAGSEQESTQDSDSMLRLSHDPLALSLSPSPPCAPSESMLTPTANHHGRADMKSVILPTLALPLPSEVLQREEVKVGEDEAKCGQVLSCFHPDTLESVDSVPAAPAAQCLYTACACLVRARVLIFRCVSGYLDLWVWVGGRSGSVQWRKGMGR